MRGVRCQQLLGAEHVVGIAKAGVPEMGDDGTRSTSSIEYPVNIRDGSGYRSHTLLVARIH